MNKQEILKEQLNNLLLNPNYQHVMIELINACNPGGESSKERNNPLRPRQISKEEMERRREMPSQIFVWCCKVKDQNSDKYFYHPIVSFSNMYAQNLAYDELFDLNSYMMLASENQFEAYDKYSPYVEAMRMCVKNVAFELIALPIAKYKKLENALNAFLSLVLSHIQEATHSLYNAQSMLNVPCDKTSIAMSLLRQAFSGETLSSFCFDQNYNISDSNNHVYEDISNNCDDEENYDEDDFYDDYDYDDDEEYC